jgi:hypothetical protein
MSGWKRMKGGNAGSKTQRRMERAPTPRQDAAVVYDDSLEGAARYAVAVLSAQVASQGRDWSPKLAHTACKKLEAALAAPPSRNGSSDHPVAQTAPLHGDRQRALEPRKGPSHG